MAQGLGVNIPLVVDAVDGAYRLLDDVKDVVRQNLKMLILTSPGERIQIPTFGVGIRRYLFENMTSRTRVQIEQKIREQVRIFMSYLMIDKIEVSTPTNDLGSPDDSLSSVLYIKIFYNVKSFQSFSDFLTLELTI
jgi:phage baseplate assembly protein W